MTDRRRVPRDVRRRPCGVWSAPGRVNLIGEHTDYNDGFVLPFAIAAQDRGGRRARVTTVCSGCVPSSSRQATWPCTSRTSTPGRPEGWAAYVAGVVWAVQQGGPRRPGPGPARRRTRAARQRALVVARTGVRGSPRTERPARTRARRQRARRAGSHTAENDFVGAPTGMMDQLASLRCIRGHALFLDIRSLEAEHVPLDPEAADLRAARRRHQGAPRQCGRGVRRSTCHVRARRTDPWRTRAARRRTDLDDALARLENDEQRRRVRHIVTENARVVATADALRATGAGRNVGTLMTASHVSLRDDYEVSCVELDVAVESLLGSGALGARMTGGGFGGSAVALLPASAVEDATTRVVGAFRGRGWGDPNAFRVSPSDGGHRDS